MRTHLKLTVAPAILAGVLGAACLAAAPIAAAKDNTQAAGTANSASARTSQDSDATMLVNESVGVVQRMAGDPQLKMLMERSKGILILPRFGRGAFVVGGRGGAGVLLTHENGSWSEPVFYNMGGISVGPQVGGAGGPVAFVLLSDKAAHAFEHGNNFSLNADAGFTIVHYSANAQGSLGKGDVVLWSGTSGAYVGGDLSVTDIVVNKSANTAFYHRSATADQILNGAVRNAAANPLKQALPG